MGNVLRLIDANANRAREAVRVMEDAARFVLNRADLSGELKTLRHDLAAVLEPVGQLSPHRNTPGDVGTSLSTEAEQTRSSIAEVGLAAGKRLSEALRAIEEYAKTLPPPGNGAAAKIEQLRYRGYELERRLSLALRPWAPRQWRLCVLLTQRLCTDRTWQEVLQGAIAGGADCIQVREKSMSDADRLQLIEEAMSIVDGRASVIVNDRVDLALLTGAHGVHLGQSDISARQARSLAGSQLIVGVSTGRLDQAKSAAIEGADYCGVGPMFKTTTVDDKPNIAGPAYLRAYRSAMDLPHLAVGGINVVRMPELVAAGARGVAVSGAVCSASDPAAVCAELISALDAAG